MTLILQRPPTSPIARPLLTCEQRHEDTYPGTVTSSSPTSWPIVANVVVVEHGDIDLASLRPRVTWVGGRLFLEREGLRFAANVPNRAVNRLLRVDRVAGNDFAVLYKDITGIRLLHRIGVKTIEVSFGPRAARIGIRCRRASSVAEQITQRVAMAAIDE